ncbi:hypothetical protein Shyhy02_14060 [Streptomyces hygroscopicus subsp. hygroscopicus]|nr:hypothetical protein Shyhy02_14060 [Streptomyces hygroscopicus subsp. hygroscopicus]
MSVPIAGGLSANPRQTISLAGDSEAGVMLGSSWTILPTVERGGGSAGVGSESVATGGAVRQLAIDGPADDGSRAVVGPADGPIPAATMSPAGTVRVASQGTPV